MKYCKRGGLSWRTKSVAALAGVVAWMGAAQWARCAEDATQSATMAGDLRSVDPYPRGTWIASTYTGFAFQIWNTPARLTSQTVGIGYFFADHFSFNVELTGVIASQPEQDIIAGGGNLLLRNHFYNNKDFSVFSDVGVGILEADHRIPPNGTDFNFTIRTGIGVAMHLNDRTDLITGIRYMHLSNAHQEGPNRNPSINAAEGYVGLMFKL